MPLPRGLKDISFIKEEIGGQVFSEVGSAGGVDNPERMLKGWTLPPEQPLVPLPPIDGTAEELILEATVGDYLTSPAGLLHILADRRRAVAIVTVKGQNYKGTEGQWSGTGVIVGRNLFLTNHHVIHSIDAAKAAQVEFDYEIAPNDLLCGVIRPPASTRKFALDPTRLFVTSPTIGGLDFSFIWIEDAAAETQGIVPMERSAFTVDKGEQAFVVHHPDGRPKEVSLDDAEIIGLEAAVIHYSSDTMEGSSGAPVFDRRGRLIALHHASRKGAFLLKDGSQTKMINEGIKISAIALDLEARIRQGARDASQAEAILKEIGGSDTMTGFFGGHGRQISSDTALEAVISTYLAAKQDIDIGFWNIEGLAKQWNDTGKLKAAARVIADLNLDLWGLLGIGEGALKALKLTLEAGYGSQYEYALSEPGAPAMVWKRSSLTGKRVEWPSKMEPLFRQRGSGQRISGIPGPGFLFDRYPGLFKFMTASDQPLHTFFVVPLHLGAMDDGGLRRRLRARILARAVEDLALDSKADVILGGDMNGPLVRSDFTIIEDKGFLVLGAQDEWESALSYVKAPTSSVDNVFLSPDMQQTVGKLDYFIVARDRAMPDYRDVSDQRPLALRLSLMKSSTAERSLDQADLDAMIDRMLRPAASRPRRTQRSPPPARSSAVRKD
jgi:hypothetical protein